MYSILLYDCIVVNLIYQAEYRYIFFHNAVLSQISEMKNPCDNIHTCKLQDKQSSCYCDQACEKYDDCCFDAILSNTSEQITKNNQHIDIKFLTCESKIFNAEYGMWVVSSCPSRSRPSDITEKCHQAENMHPVSSEDGTTFRNVYCAYCHGVRQYNSWRFEFFYGGTCIESKMESFNPNIPNKMRYIIDNCEYRFVPPTNANVRTCVEDAIREATEGSSCSIFQSPVNLDDQLYRNIHCYNQSESSYITSRCLIILPSRMFENRGYASNSLTGIFNIRPVLDMFGKRTCEDNFYYDTTKVDIIFYKTIMMK